MRRTRIAAVAAALATTVPALAAGNALAASPTTFNHTGAEQTYVVPKNVRSLDVTAVGAPGGFSYFLSGTTPGGRGGIVNATLPVTPGQKLHVFVGGTGAVWTSVSGIHPGGFNGGGASADIHFSASGGGATDIRTAAGDLNSRLVVAGGGGGAGFGSVSDATGADAGFLNGGTAANGSGQGGEGGTRARGGVGGWANGGQAPGGDGSFGQRRHRRRLGTCCGAGAAAAATTAAQAAAAPPAAAAARATSSRPRRTSRTPWTPRARRR